ncbi:hypothetical protein [Burkholderia sp. Bp8963]|uniref:hypothetical protein n=1 Tax=Burkholderia sp. Bp8963 TaxID=2184547 RepID=UPI00163B16C1|nr:hypothetical protein [Burkholderia sp. Bp8963]
MKTMYYRSYVAEELAYIDAMVSQLEQTVESRNIGRKTAVAVTLPDYWRIRVKAIAGLPQDLQPQADALLMRLDAIDTATERLSANKRVLVTQRTSRMK